MKLCDTLIALVLLSLNLTRGASPGSAPPLPITGTRIVNVATEAQLQTAMGNLQSGDTILLADGTYSLSSTLYINGRKNVTIRGSAGSTNVVLAGKGMDNRNYGFELQFERGDLEREGSHIKTDVRGAASPELMRSDVVLLCLG